MGLVVEVKDVGQTDLAGCSRVPVMADAGQLFEDAQVREVGWMAPQGVVLDSALDSVAVPVVEY